MKKCILLFLGVVLSMSSKASAELIYASTVFRNLVSFDSSAPGTINSSVAITGLVDNFESIAGIDYRPADGKIYALGNAPNSIYRLYTLDTTSGVATRVGTTDFNFNGTNFGFDFNPAADRIRVVNDLNSSFRLNPNDGTLVATDTSLNPSSSVVAVAYDRNDTNAATPTTLFGIDSATDQLVRIGGIDGAPSPNLGAVTSIGALGVNTTGTSSFDISGTGVAFASLSTIGGGIPSSLYTINLSTGAATLIGQFGNGLDGITGITAVPEPTSATLLGLGILFTLRRKWRRPVC